MPSSQPAARPGIGLAIHAIGDRAAAAVLDAVERAPARASGLAGSTASSTRSSFVPTRSIASPRLGVTASIQPIHAAADRDLVESCWDGRQDRAYAWRSLPIRRGATWRPARMRRSNRSTPGSASSRPSIGACPNDDRGRLAPAQSLTVAEALSAYTLGPARAIGARDEGHLRPGARADLAVLSVDFDTLLAADERLADVRAEIAMIDGIEVPTT